MAAKRPAGGTAAGLSGGTGFAGLVSLFPDNIEKSALLILAPSISIVISVFWKTAIYELRAWVDDWKLRRELRAAQAFYRRLENYPNASPELKEQAEATLRSIMETEMLIRKQRAERILKDQ
jgi:hypothetical protein